MRADELEFGKMYTVEIGGTNPHEHLVYLGDGRVMDLRALPVYDKLPSDKFYFSRIYPICPSWTYIEEFPDEAS